MVCETVAPDLLMGRDVLRAGSLFITWVVVSVVFLIGFIVLGIPAWIAAHRLRRVHWYDAALLGAVVAGAGRLFQTLPLSVTSARVAGGEFVLCDAYYAVVCFSTTLQMVLVAVAGASAGITIWKIAYGLQSKAA